MTPRKIAAFAIGPLGGALIAVVTLPIVTWLFSQEDVGKLAMLQVAIAFTSLLFSLGLDQAYVREFHGETDKPVLFKCALLPGLSLLFLTLLALLSFGGTIAGWLFERPEWHLSLLVAVILLAAFATRFLSLVLRMNERGLAYSMGQLLPKLIFLLIIAGYIFQGVGATLTNLVIANTVAYVVCCGVVALTTREDWSAGMKATLDWIRLERMLRFGVPLILGGIAFWGLTAIDKVFLRTLASFDELGVYSVAVSFAGVATILQSVFSTVWAPMVYKWASTGTGLEKTKKITRHVLCLVVVMFCLAGLLSWAVTLFLPASYTAVQWILVSCLGAPLLYTLSETTVVGIGITKRSLFAMLAALLAFIVNLFGNWLLIPRCGATGAAISTCCSFWVFLVLRTEFASYVWRPVPRLQLYTYSAIVVAVACTHTFLGSESYPLIQAIWAALLAAALLSFKNEISEAAEFLASTLKSPK